MTATTIQARLTGDAEASTITILHSSECDHVDTMCTGCTGIWAIDWQFDQSAVGSPAPAAATPLQETQMLVGELMALGYDPRIEHLGNDDWAAVLPAGDGLWLITACGNLLRFEGQRDFLRCDFDPSWADYLSNQGEGCTPEQVAIWADRSFIERQEDVAPLPVPARTVRVATAPAFTRRDVYTGRWQKTYADLPAGRRISEFKASELADLAPHGIIWQHSGSVDGRYLFTRTRYIANAAGDLHFYDSTGRKIAWSPADRGVRVLAKV